MITKELGINLRLKCLRPANVVLAEPLPNAIGYAFGSTGFVQPHPTVLKTNQALLVESAQGLLVSFLAGTENLTNLLRRTLVADLQEAPVVVQRFEDVVAE